MEFLALAAYEECECQNWEENPDSDEESIVGNQMLLGLVEMVLDKVPDRYPCVGQYPWTDPRTKVLSYSLR